MFKAVPMNFLQRLGLAQRNEGQKPDPFGRTKMRGTILKVYDQETLDTEEIPRRLQRLLDQNPGVIYALVRGPLGKQYFLEFEESEQQLFSTYGVRLEGDECDIMCQNLNIEAGTIRPSKRKKDQTINLAQQTRTLSISKLV